MRWICRACGATYTTNSGKPSGGVCKKKDKDGRMKPHSWVKND